MTCAERLGDQSLPAELGCRAVVLTPEGRGAVACVLLEGCDAPRVVSALFQPAAPVAWDRLPPARLAYGFWDLSAACNCGAPGHGVDSRDGGGAGAARSGLHEQVVVCRRSDQQIEVHCHGGAAVTAALLQSLAAHGCTTVSPTDWVHLREPDVLVAEARLALSEARTEKAAAVLLDQYRGALSRAVRQVIAELQAHRSQTAAEQLQELIERSRFGQRLTTAWRVVLIGRANSGKSSLINCLLGYSRSLVHHEAGTTRDTLMAITALDGWPVELVDTAGTRPAASEWERQGLERAGRQLAQADLVLLVADAAADWSQPDSPMAVLPACPQVLVHNKTDLVDRVPPDRPPGVAVSALTGDGIDDLRAEMTSQLFGRVPPWGTAVPFRRRHARLLLTAQRAVERGAHQCARDALDRLLSSREEPPESPEDAPTDEYAV